MAELLQASRDDRRTFRSRCASRPCARPARPRRALPRDDLHGHVRTSCSGSVAGSLTLSDVLTVVFLVAVRVGTGSSTRDGRLTRTSAVALAFLLAFPLVYLIGFFNLETAQALAQWAKGMVKFVLHFVFLVAGVALLARRGERFYWCALGGVLRRPRAQRRSTASSSSARRGPGANLDAVVLSPITGGASRINIYGASAGAERLPPERAHRRPEPPRDRARRSRSSCCCRSTCGSSADTGCARRSPCCSASCSSSSSRRSRAAALLGLVCGAARARGAVPAACCVAPRSSCRSGLSSPSSVRSSSRGWTSSRPVLRSRVDTSRRGASTHFVVYDFIPDVLSPHPLLRARAEQLLRLLRVRHRPDELRAALVLRRADRRDGHRRRAPVRRVPRLPVPAARRGAEDRARARGRGRPARRARAAARVGADGRARRDDRRERLLPDDDLLLLLRLRDARARAADRVRAARDAT